MKKGTVITIIIILIVVALAWWFYAATSNNQMASVPPTSTSTTSGGTGTALTTPSGAPFDQNITNGAITLQYPSADFTAVETSSQITAVSYIPPCDPSFNYCLYYINTSTYAHTNFESAGLRIQDRTDLTTQAQCLNTSPTGFTGATSTVASSSDYATSIFPNVGGAAAGHFASGALYRLYYPTTGACYEFETRIGQSDYENYPSGTIGQFTTSDESAVQGELQEILGTVTLSDGTAVTWPQ